jgi:SAM-dependent methyltransferase
LNNIDNKTVDSFGDEWTRFDQSKMTSKEVKKAFDEYFSVFPWNSLPSNAEGFDMGCGSGRWANLVASKVDKLNCIDPSSAINIARSQLSHHQNIIFHQDSIESTRILNESQDFGYSLGVLHHVPDTSSAIKSCVDLLKPGAPFLVYLYYAFDGRPFWFKLLWKISDFIRKIVFRMPPSLKNFTTDTIAAIVYFPLAKAAFAFSKLGLPTSNFPLSFYKDHSFYTMRTDSRDRFGTPLEQRYTKDEIFRMMNKAGLQNIIFSDQAPFWCVVGFKE